MNSAFEGSLGTGPRTGSAWARSRLSEQARSPLVRILVIEDEEAVLSLVTKILSRVGHDVDGVSNGREGLRRFEASPVDLVITDINMPDMDGLEVMKAFRSVRADVPIIAISGGGLMPQEVLLSIASRLGASEMVSKPFATKELISAVERAVERDEGSAMTCVVEIDALSDVAIVRLAGVATVSELEQAMARLRLHPEYQEGVPRLWDIREAGISKLTPDEFRGIARAGHASGLSGRGTRVAVLVATDIDFRVARKFELTEGKDLPATIRVFRDPNVAMAWLAEGQG